MDKLTADIKKRIWGFSWFCDIAFSACTLYLPEGKYAHRVSTIDYGGVHRIEYQYDGQGRLTGLRQAPIVQ